jgi:hypothetical protein
MELLRARRGFEGGQGVRLWLHREGEEEVVVE